MTRTTSATRVRAEIAGRDPRVVGALQVDDGGDDRQPDPDGGVIEHRHAERQLAQVPVQDAEVGEDLDDHRHRADRQRQSREDREGRRGRLRPAQPGIGGQRERHGGQQGQHQGPDTDQGHRARLRADEPHVHGGTGHPDEQDAAEGRDAAEELVLPRGRCEQPGTALGGGDRAEDGRSEQQTGRQLTGRGRQTDPLGQPTEEVGHGQQDAELEQENRRIEDDRHGAQTTQPGALSAELRVASHCRPTEGESTMTSRAGEGVGGADDPG